MEKSSTYGVGPQNTEKEKTCKTAKAIKTSPVTTFNQSVSVIWKIPTSLFVSVGKQIFGGSSGGKGEVANQAGLNKITSVLTNKENWENLTIIAQVACMSAPIRRD